MRLVGAEKKREVRTFSQTNIHEAKTHFSRLIQRVAAGEEITIA